MVVTFKGFKIFSFRSYLWTTCLLPGSVRNIMSGTKRLTYTAGFSHDNRCVWVFSFRIYSGPKNYPYALSRFFLSSCFTL